ncbi:MAG: hypothetical protein AAF662_02225 [Pseudomonadota bacterium]
MSVVARLVELTHPDFSTVAGPLPDAQVDELQLWQHSVSFPVYRATGAMFDIRPGVVATQHANINLMCDQIEADGGGMGVFPAGDYYISDSVRPGNYTILYFMPGARLFLMNGSSTAGAGRVFPILNKDTSGGNVGIHIIGGGLVDGNGANQTGEFSSICLVGCELSSVVDMGATGALRTGTFGSGVSKHGEGIELIECTDVEVLNCRTFENVYDGIKPRSCVRFRASGNRSWDNGRSAIQISTHDAGGAFGGTFSIDDASNGTRDFTLVDNKGWHSTGLNSAPAPRTSGLYLHTCRDGVISNNIMRGHQQGLAAFDANEKIKTDHNIWSAREQCIAFEENQQVEIECTKDELVGELATGSFIDNAGTRCKFFDLGFSKTDDAGPGTWDINIEAPATDTVLKFKEPTTIPVNDLGARTVKTPFADNLVYGASIDWLPVVGNVPTLTLLGDGTLANASRLEPGFHSLKVVQGGAGGHTLSFGTNYLIPSSISVAFSTAAGAIDVLRFMCDGTNMYLVGFEAGYTEPVAGESGIVQYDGGDGTGPPAAHIQRWHTAELTPIEESGGTLLLDKSGAGRNAFSWDLLDGFTNGEILVEFEIIGPSTTNGGYYAIVFRGSGDDTSESGYLAQLTRNGGADRISIGKYTGASYTNIDDTNKAWASNTVYRMRVFANGSDLRARFWDAAATEPSNWDVSITDSDHASGWGGHFAFFDSDVRVRFLSYATGGETTPTP